MLPQDTPLVAIENSVLEKSAPAGGQVPEEHTNKRLGMRTGKFVRNGIGIGIVSIAFLYCLPYLLGVITSDIPPIDDSDLVPAVHNVPIEQNGWRFMEELNAEVDRTGLHGEPLRELVQDPDMEQVRTLLETNTRAFEFFEAIADAPYYQDPGSSDPATFSADTTLSPLGALRDMTYLSLLRAHVAKLANDATSTARAIEVPCASRSTSHPPTPRPWVSW